ncbi:MAG: ATP-binding protein [Pseudomonadota bacterium]
MKTQQKYDLDLLQQRLDYLEEGNRITLDALDMAASLGNFPTTISNLQDATAILKETRIRAQRLIPLKTVAFYLINETNSEFCLRYCFPETEQTYISQEIDRLIDNRTFAWAVHENRPIIVAASDYTQQIILHVMATSSRTRGIFVGHLTEKEPDIPLVSLSLLSIVMQNSANAIESFELYRMIKDHSANLEKKVQKRTEELSYRVSFEKMVANISTSFISHSPDAINAGIQKALQTIGEFINAERGYVLLLSQKHAGIDHLYSWSTKEETTDIGILRGSNIIDIPIFYETVQKKEGCLISNLADLPQEILKQNNIIASIGIKSLVVVPMISGSLVVGLLVFDSLFEEKHWAGDMVSLMKIAGETLGNAVERKKADMEKAGMQAQFLRAQKLEAIGTLAGGIAHNFNNLLAVVQGNAQLIEMGSDPSSLHYELANEIEMQTKTGTTLTRELLGFARGGKYEVAPLNINEVIQTTSSTFGRTKKEIRMHSALQEDLPLIEADRGQLEQILMNLYVNASHAMPSGGDLYLETRSLFTAPKGRAASPGGEPKEYIVISVRDTGCGMDEKTLERIFEPFFTTKEMGKGTGLGLASVYGIVQNHKGFVDVKSKVGVGTTFDIYLPSSGEKSTKQQTAAIHKTADGGKETILIIDDEESFLKLTARYLTRLGYTVLAANNGQAGLDLYKDNKDKIDMIILDMIMPDMSGSNVFDGVRGLNAFVKILLSSGYSLEGQATELMDRGCNGFIQKPFNIEALANKIREILENKN